MDFHQILKSAIAYILGEMPARARLLCAVGLRDAVHVAQRRQARLQVQLRALRQVRLLAAHATTHGVH